MAGDCFVKKYLYFNREMPHKSISIAVHHNLEHFKKEIYKIEKIATAIFLYESN